MLKLACVCAGSSFTGDFNLESGPDRAAAGQGSGSKARSWCTWEWFGALQRLLSVGGILVADSGPSSPPLTVRMSVAVCTWPISCAQTLRHRGWFASHMKSAQLWQLTLPTTGRQISFQMGVNEDEPSLSPASMSFRFVDSQLGRRIGPQGVRALYALLVERYG